jgi:salicylate hydroxylase
VSPAPLSAIVVGAGQSGLGAAIALSLAGHYVTVFDPVDISQTELLVGAGLQVTPNSAKILQRWGVPNKLWESASEPTSLFVHRFSGKILALEEHFDKNTRRKYGAPFIDVHRGDLQLALYERAKSLGVRFKFNERVESIDFEAAEITTANGLKAQADLIIAADGLWSKCRECFLQREDPPRPTGDLAYRIVLNLDQIDDPELREWVQNPTVHFWIGPGAHAVGYSLRAGKMYNVVLLVPDDLPPNISRQPGSVDQMKSLFKDWDPMLTRFLDIVDKVDKWKLMHSKATSIHCIGGQ